MQLACIGKHASNKRDSLIYTVSIVAVFSGTEPQVDNPLGDESMDIHETETIPAT